MVVTYDWLQTFLCIAVVTVMLSVLYVVTQQNYRQTWNDPQTEIAERVVRNLEDGQAFPQALDRPSHKIELTTGHHSTWVAQFDADGKVLSSEGLLNGGAISIPEGVFEAAKNNAGKDTREVGQSRITWEPLKGVREAIVVQYSSRVHQFVVAGRSMQELERRIGTMSRIIFITWFCVIALLVMAPFAMRRMHRS
jgi:hypothetical protein